VSHTHSIVDQRDVSNLKTVIGDGVRITYHATVQRARTWARTPWWGRWRWQRSDVRPYHMNVGIPAKSVRVKPNAPPEAYKVTLRKERRSPGCGRRLGSAIYQAGAGSIPNGPSSTQPGNVLMAILNNTPYNLIYSQTYSNHGDIEMIPGTIGPSGTGNVGGSIFNAWNTFGVYGASGALELTITDPATNAQIGTLSIAYSNHISGNANATAVDFNQSLESWFNTFNSNTQYSIATAELQASNPYPQFNAAAGVNPTGTTTMVVTLSS
jgi:hypothetical protein